MQIKKLKVMMMMVKLKMNKAPEFVWVVSSKGLLEAF